MSLSRSAARGAATTLVGQWLRFAIQLVALVVLARLLSPADYGLVAMVTALTGIAFLLGDFGLSSAAIQARTISHAQKSNLFWINVGIGASSTVAVFLLAGPIAGFYGHPQLVAISQVICVMFLLEAASAQFSAEVSRNLRFVSLAFADTASQLVGLIAAIGIALAGGGYWALVAQQVLASLIKLIVLIVAARWRPQLPSRRAGMRQLLTFGSNTLGVQLINYVSSNLDSILVARVWGSTALGYYSRATQLFKLPLQQIASPMGRVALPILSRITDPSTYAKYVERAQLVLVYVLGGAFFFTAAISNPLISVVLGPTWLPAASLFSILAIGGVFQAMGYIYYWVLQSKGMTGIQLRYSVIARCLMIAFLCGGVVLGPWGAALGSSLGLFANWLLLTIFAIPKTGVDTWRLVKSAVRPLIVFTVMIVVTYPASLLLGEVFTPVGQLSISCAIGLSMIGICWLISRGVRTDIRFVIETARRVRT